MKVLLLLIKEVLQGHILDLKPVLLLSIAGNETKINALCETRNLIQAEIKQKTNASGFDKLRLQN